ncbi:MAG: DUF5399 domain-containing protein [Parachlamydiaceae bacterium]
MMATIDQLDLSVYNLYAIRTRMVEQINQQLQLDKASSIPPQTLMMDNYPRLDEIDLLLGIVPLNTPWAYFLPPKKFRLVRRSPFAFSRVAPSLGSVSDQEGGEALVDSMQCESPEEEKERAAIKGCFKQLGQINRWLGYIVGRMGQFLQG